jgi:hypothetical protein
MPNGLNYDYSDENEFKAFLIQSLTTLQENTKDLPDIKTEIKKIPLLEQDVIQIKTDMKDDKFWGNVKAASGPVMVALHIAAKKIGINI